MKKIKTDKCSMPQLLISSRIVVPYPPSVLSPATLSYKADSALLNNTLSSQPGPHTHRHTQTQIHKRRRHASKEAKKKYTPEPSRKRNGHILWERENLKVFIFHTGSNDIPLRAPHKAKKNIRSIFIAIKNTALVFRSPHTNQPIHEYGSINMWCERCGIVL